jgi:hypothetical protein
MTDEHYIEFGALIGPIDPPYKLHTFTDGRPQNTVHGELVERLHNAIAEIDHDAGTSAHVTTEADIQQRAEVEDEVRQLRGVVTAVHMLVAALDRGSVTDELAVVREKLAALDEKTP